MIKLNTTPKLFQLSEIEEAVATLQAGDPDWRYEAVNADGAEGPYASIRIYDEEGEFIGYFSAG